MLSSSLRFLCTILLSVLCTAWAELLHEQINIKDFHPTHENQYVCTGAKVPEDAPRYLRGFEPSDANAAAHHILLYGCANPGMEEAVWNCGEMMAQDPRSHKRAHSKPDLKTGPICGKGASTILFAEAMQAGSYKLPDKVSFHIGKDSQYKFLVIQIHYGNVDKFLGNEDAKDSSGIKYTYQTSATQFLGGVYLLGVGSGVLDSNVVYPNVQTFDVVCRNDRPRDRAIVPFAYRTHAHNNGVLISGWRVREDEDYWSLIGRMSPQMEQTFYPVEQKMLVEPEDTLAARCTYSNPSPHPVSIGPNMSDEMCNFYIMYYTLDGTPFEKQACFEFDYQSWEGNGLKVPGEVEDLSLGLSDQEIATVDEYLQSKKQM